MQIETTPIKDLLIITPRVFKDSRGYFFESFNLLKFKELTDIAPCFVQDNQSFSTFGTIRGLHFQTGEMAQAKLVSVAQGEVLDVAVDLRTDSSTYGQNFSVYLSGENHKMFYIPRGFAHGFSVFSESAIFTYKCDNYYSPEHERGIIYNDSDLGIDWKVPQEQQILSPKDLVYPRIKEWDKK